MQCACEQSLSQHLSQKGNLGVMQCAREQSHKPYFMGPQKGRPNAVQSHSLKSWEILWT